MWAKVQIWLQKHDWIALRRIAISYALLGLTGVLGLVLLTPPFQVPDEQQHFERAYQLSEIRTPVSIQNGAAGAVLPSSIVLLEDRFLRTRTLNTNRPVRPMPLRLTLGALSIPLNTSRREFIDFSGSASYWPLPYAPQIVAIIVGRKIGLGPLGLLYAARLVNGVAAVLVTTVAIAILPVGAVPLFTLALLPMALYLYASASPDAAVIASALLFTAIAMRARQRGFWRMPEVALACIAGVIFCPLKPVYAPLLLIAFPSALRRERAIHVIFVHVFLLLTILGCTALWLHYRTTSTMASAIPARTISNVLPHLLTFVMAVFHSIRVVGFEWLQGIIGLLGWLTIPLPKFMYALPLLALIASLFVPSAGLLQIGRLETAWYLLLLIASALLVILAMYVYWIPNWNPDSAFIGGVQGRYFLPLAGLVAVTLQASVKQQRWGNSLVLGYAAVSLVGLEILLCLVVIIRAYNLF